MASRRLKGLKGLRTHFEVLPWAQYLVATALRVAYMINRVAEKIHIPVLLFSLHLFSFPTPFLMFYP